jgi:hypothetical protein
MTPEYAARYWYIPRLIFLAVLVSLLTLKHPVWVRTLSGAMLLWVAIFAAVHWRYTPLPDLQFQRYARDFERAPTGTQVAIPISPVGWTLRLTKK